MNQLGSGALAGISFDGQDRLLGYQPKEGGAVGFTYAANGNLLSNGDSATGKTYSYGGPRPHAVTQVGTDTFDYDANGNMVKDASRAMAYSATNQLTQVKMANGGVVDMDYDFTGARVTKKSVIKDVNGKTWQTTTHYLGEAMEIRLTPVVILSEAKDLPVTGTVLLHVSANGQRIATMTVGTLADVLKPIAGTLWGIPFNQLPPLVAFSLLLALLIAVMPGRQRIVTAVRQRFVMPGLTRHPVCRAPFVLSLSKGAIIALLLVVIQFAGIPLALAGDAGLPAIPPSDANYLVFYHGDHLGSAQLITEGNTKGKHAGITYKKGDVIQRFEYAAYGRESFVLNPNLSWDPAFTGQQYDIETGLYYYRARYYNPILGRFIQPDTIVQDALDPQSWNRYAYVRNNPLKYVDPSGNVIEVVLDHPDREHTVAEDAAGMDWSDAPSYDSVSDIPDGTYGEVTVGGTDAFVDIAGSGGSSGQVSDVKSDSVDHAKTGDLGRDSSSHEVAQSTTPTEGGLVGASVSQGGGVSNTTTSGFISSAVSFARTASPIITGIGFVALIAAPPIGAAILNANTLLSVGITIYDYSSGNISTWGAAKDLGAIAAGYGVGKAATNMMGLGKIGYHFGAARFYSTTTGQFIKTSIGNTGIAIGETIGQFTSTIIDLYKK